MATGDSSSSNNTDRVGFRVRPDLFAVDCRAAPRDSLTHLYLDALVHEPRMLRYLLVRHHGPRAHRAGLGLSVPARGATSGPAHRVGGLDAPTMARLLHGTALEWLGLPHTAFA